MSVSTYTKSGNKASASIKLDKSIFDLTIKNHDSLKAAYVTYLANGRSNLAVTKTRGLIRGGGRKPWRQKGTGRARFGSSRNPIWRGGGIVFGPTGQENFSHKLNQSAKRQALRQALSLAAKSDQLKVIETFDSKDGLVKSTVKLLEKLEAKGNVLIVVSVKNELVERATRNLSNVKAVQAKYLNVYDILNADQIIISQKALGIISEWLGQAKAKVEAKS
ncbi:MAG TPA: 50S ribosomal protein L4 [Candidatus Saccharimonadales bacterium]|nr:50S ribosomal protein L4 [Candidatus Saccharimonadales bacterium]